MIHSTADVLRPRDDEACSRMYGLTLSGGVVKNLSSSVERR